jgi:hypothetical protein
VAVAALAGNKCGHCRDAARLMGADAFGTDILELREGVGFWGFERSVGAAAAAALVPDFHIVPEIDATVIRAREDRGSASTAG